jgi:uncharacterized protein YjbI with pentapeptide repeats
MWEAIKGVFRRVAGVFRRSAVWFRDRSLPIASLLSAIGLLVTAGAVLWLTGRPQGGPWYYWHVEPMPWKDRLTYAAAVATGVGAMVALVVSYRKQRDAEEGKFAAQFAAAAAQLGDDAPAVRIAGAYAVAALADRHQDRRQQCIDVLTGYLRLPYNPDASHNHLIGSTVQRTKGVDGNQATVTDTSAYRPADREVRLTIIRIIRDHLQDPAAATTWCVRDLDFTGATFDGGDFRDATFSGGTVDFDGATFSGGTVYFDGATFSGGTVDFRDATFSGGTVDFVGATFSGGTVDFVGATFSGGTVYFFGATFSRGTVDFRDATFSGGEVTFDRAKFKGGTVYFGGAKFMRGTVDFRVATFSGGTVDFFGATFSGGEVIFDRAKFLGGTISFVGATFSGGTITLDEKPFRGWSADAGSLPPPNRDDGDDSAQ